MKAHKASDIMTTTVITATKDMRLTDVIKLLLRWHISGLPVVDEGGNLIGIISEHDIMNFAFSGEAGDTRVEQAMSRDVISFPPDAPVETLLRCCSQRRIRRVPIVKDKKVVGIVSRRDILREMDRLYSQY